MMFCCKCNLFHSVFIFDSQYIQHLLYQICTVMWKMRPSSCQNPQIFQLHNALCCKMTSFSYLYWGPCYFRLIFKADIYWVCVWTPLQHIYLCSSLKLTIKSDVKIVHFENNNLEGIWGCQINVEINSLITLSRVGGRKDRKEGREQVSVLV